MKKGRGRPMKKGRGRHNWAVMGLISPAKNNCTMLTKSMANHETSQGTPVYLQHDNKQHNQGEVGEARVRTRVVSLSLR